MSTAPTDRWSHSGSRPPGNSDSTRRSGTQPRGPGLAVQLEEPNRSQPRSRAALREFPQEGTPVRGKGLGAVRPALLVEAAEQVEVLVEPVGIDRQAGSEDRGRVRACVPGSGSAVRGRSEWRRGTRPSRPSGYPRPGLPRELFRCRGGCPSPGLLAGAHPRRDPRAANRGVPAGGRVRRSGVLRSTDRTELVAWAVAHEAQRPQPGSAVAYSGKRVSIVTVWRSAAHDPQRRLAAEVAPPDARPFPGGEDVAAPQRQLFQTRSASASPGHGSSRTPGAGAVRPARPRDSLEIGEG